MSLSALSDQMTSAKEIWWEGSSGPKHMDASWEGQNAQCCGYSSATWLLVGDKAAFAGKSMRGWEPWLIFQVLFTTIGLLCFVWFVLWEMDDWSLIVCRVQMISPKVPQFNTTQEATWRAYAWSLQDAFQVICSAWRVRSIIFSCPAYRSTGNSAGCGLAMGVV